MLVLIQGGLIWLGKWIQLHQYNMILINFEILFNIQKIYYQILKFHLTKLSVIPNVVIPSSK